MEKFVFPGETTAYRQARDELAVAEFELRQQLEAVAARRRALPLGGEVPHDYLFAEAGAPVRQTRLSELFEPGKDTLLLYSFMFSAEMPRACPMCTSLLDGLNGAAPDVVQRVNFAVVGKAPIERLTEYATSRGWTNLRLLSSHGTTYNRDYRGERDTGEQRSTMNVFVHRDSVIHHFYATESENAPSVPGQDDRHVDLLWPLWNLLDLTPKGRGDWRPGQAS